MGDGVPGDRLVRVVTGLGSVATGTAGILYAVSAGGPTGTARVVAVAIGVSGLLVGLGWLVARGVSRTAAIVFGVYAEVCITTAALLVEERYLGQYVGVILGVVATYAVFFLDGRRLAAQVAATVTVLLVLAGLALAQHPDDPAGVLGRLLSGLLVAAVFPVYVQRYIGLVHGHAHEQRELARRDPLTGLLNRRGLESLVDGLATSASATTTTTLLVLDLDRFKEVNDEHGHARGDEVLARLGARLVTHVGELGWAARTGGEEFVVLLAGPDGPADPAVAASSARTLLEVVHRRDDAVPVTASIGVVHHRGRLDRRRARALLDAADEAMYRAKRAGGARVEVGSAVH